MGAVWARPDSQTGPGGDEQRNKQRPQQLSPELLDLYSIDGLLSRAELRSAWNRWQELGGSLQRPLGILTVAEGFAALRNNPWAPRICLVASGGRATLRWEELLGRVLGVFSPAADRNRKTRFAFCLFDWDADGYIGVEDLRHSLELICGGGYSSSSNPANPSSSSSSNSSSLSSAHSTTADPIHSQGQHQQSQHPQPPQQPPPAAPAPPAMSAWQSFRSWEAFLLRASAAVIEEGDMTGSHKLSYPEFARLLRGCPDFVTNFQFVV